jgi:hypothetical protein
VFQCLYHNFGLYSGPMKPYVRGAAILKTGAQTAGAAEEQADPLGPLRPAFFRGARARKWPCKSINRASRIAWRACYEGVSATLEEKRDEFESLLASLGSAAAGERRWQSLKYIG